MVRVGLISLVLLYMVAFTFGRYGYPSIYGSSYGTSYNPASTYRSPYGSTYGAGYGSGYGSSAYKTSYSAVSVAPLCKSDGRMMLRVYVEEGGLPVNNAKVSYVDNKVLDTVSTDQYGYIAIPVYGCTVALMVYHKDDNPVYRTVDLMSSKTREEKVVIKVDDKCNFNLYFAHEAEGPDDDGDDGPENPPCTSLPCDSDASTQLCTSCGDEHQLVSIIIHSADHTEYEQAVAKTTCITAGEIGAELIVMLKSQYGNVRNVLSITITDSRSAVIALPPQLEGAEKIFDTVFISNTYEAYGDTTTSEIVNRIAYWMLLPNVGSTIDKGDVMTFTDVSSAVVEAGQLAGDEWLLAILFDTSVNSASTKVDLEGNVYIMDANGDYQTVQHPDDGDDYDEDIWFLVGCFCKNVPSMKAGDFIAIGTYESGTPSYASNCNLLCVTANSA